MSEKIGCVSIVGNNGEITVPLDALAKLGIKPGDTVAVLGDTKKGLAIVKNSMLIKMVQSGKVK